MAKSRTILKKQVDFTECLLQKPIINLKAVPSQTEESRDLNDYELLQKEEFCCNMATD